MLRFMPVIALAAALAGALPAMADDASDVQGVIGAQLKAFKAGDGASAYSFAAPSIKQMFPSADLFMAMVRGGYPAVADPATVAYGPMRSEGSAFRQDVFLTDKSGQNFIASYTLERQADGSLKITSCAIRKADAVSA